MLRKLPNVLTVILSLIALFGTGFGVYSYFENRYALAGEVKKLEQRLENKIVTDQFLTTQQRIWELQDRAVNQKRKLSLDETRDIERLKEQKILLEKKLDSLSKGGVP